MQHIKRWLTAIVLAPIVIWILVKGNIVLLAALISVVAVLAVREYLRIIFGKDKDSASNTIKIISYSVSLALIWGACLHSWEILFLILTVNFMALSVFVLARFDNTSTIFDKIEKQVLGIVYIPVPLSLLIFIRDFEGGSLWILWLLLVTFASDTGALYSGTFFGKHPLAPIISPNKTIEGSIGGLITAMLVGFIFCMIFFKDLSLAFRVLPCALIMAVAGQIGDLFESAMKRASGVKDSGRLLPGHGGMLDRIDAVLLVIPVIYIYLVYVL